MRIHSGASPQPDEACIRGLGSSAGGVGFRLALKAVHNVAVPACSSGGRCRPSLQPEPVMTLPRTAAEVLSGT